MCGQPECDAVGLRVSWTSADVPVPDGNLHELEARGTYLGTRQDRAGHPGPA